MDRDILKIIYLFILLVINNTILKRMIVFIQDLVKNKFKIY